MKKQQPTALVAQQSQGYTNKVAVLLIYARKISGLSARELARRVGSSHSTILAYEAGKKVPITTALMRLIHACGFSLDFHLAPRIRGDAHYPKGPEIEEVLEQASNFPTNHSEKPDAILKL